MSDDLERSLRARWRFLEGAGDACCVVTRRMEVVYLNETARSLVPEGWFGSRCWEVFPVGERACAGTCPAVRWVATAAGDGYCEEALSVEGSRVVLGVAVLRLAERESSERALLVLRPRDEASSFPERLLADARRLRARAEGAPRAPDGSPVRPLGHGRDSGSPGDFPQSPASGAPEERLTRGASGE